MLEKERAALRERLNSLCKAAAGSALPVDKLFDEMRNACADAVSMMDALGFALDEAFEELNHMGGCPTCLHNRAPNPRADIAICDRRLPFPQKGCYVWKGTTRIGWLRKEQTP